MTRAKRLLELIMYINQQRKFTVKELANEFDVSTRTIFRDLQDLSDLGVPLYAESGPNGGYQILRERFLPPIAFTEEETVAIFFAIHALRHYSSLPFNTELTSVTRKFIHYVPHDLQHRIENMKNRVDFITPTRKADTPHLQTLLDGSIKQKVLQITYHSREGKTIREIQPIGIYAYEGLWYCPAFCYLRSEYRVFRCDRIESAVYSPTKSQNLSDIHLENRLIKNPVKGKLIRCFVELSKTGLQKCEQERWLTAYLHHRQDGTGWIEGEFPQKDIPFLATFFVGLGKDATVKHPQELVDEIEKLLSQLLERYRKVKSSRETR